MFGTNNMGYSILAQNFSCQFYLSIEVNVNNEGRRQEMSEEQEKLAIRGEKQCTLAE